MASKIDEDKIAVAFHNSTRKTLNYIPPSVQNGEVIVRPSIDMIRAGSRRWNTTAVGYFLGKKPYFHHLNEFVRSIWPGVRDVNATSNGFFFFQFETVAAMEEVIEGGPWLYLGQPIVLQKWEPGMVLRKLKHTEVPVWIKLRHLPVELWTTEGLSTVASGIGRPLYPDAITRACTRLDFARVCVMLNVSSNLPKHVVIMMPNELGGESACKVDVEYEWLPPKCKQCVSLGHSTATCPESNKIEKPKVAVYVQKRPVQPPPTVTTPMAKDVVRTVQHTVPEEDGTVHMEIGTDERSYIDKGKAPLAKCDIMNAAFWNVRGLNRRDHQVAVKELVNEFRLNFLGLLETRVSAVNVLRVQTFLPRWSWFTDYDMPGNRIWIAWDDDLLDVDVLNLDVQFIHCRISIRCAHLSVLATVVYGANDTVSRRGLWQSLVTLADSISDEPWIVGGDFNTVVDMSEVCGASADIHLAMNEFRDCIQGTGLIHLPVQGELFSWHNCSEGDRSLWKRLDRLLVNDAWLRLWPNSHYQCLNARTSDHSPLVLRGDTDNHTVSMFRFDNYLTMSSDFIPLVQNVWRHRIEGTSMYAVTRKLRALKPVFRTLRKKKGDLSVNVKLAAEFLATVQQLLQIDRHNTLLLCLEKCCKLVFFKATKLEQVMLQQRAKIQWLKGGDQCSRIFFRKVAMRRASKRVFQIRNEDGHTLTTQEDVVNEFVSFYQRLLGGDRRREFIDLRYLRPWARHVLTQEESQELVQSVTREEIKDAFFDIAEDKARPGWILIGSTVETGQHHTILALIPKRLRLVLDKLISPSQNAFVPGRSIGDNILLAQELFAGYNRQGLPMRCALKVDLRKAYDTVEWDFLSAVLQMFGFPGTFIGWVEECVTTPMFSVCINGNPHGFFKGSRGLRQGDPMSPFLFVLIMEVLQLMLLQLIDQNEGSPSIGGARSLDFSNFALQMTSSSSVKRMWIRFGFLDTGWPSSPNCPGYMPIHKRVSLFSPVQHRMSGNNYLQHYISRRVTFPSGWESIQLSFAGRIQLIKSVLMSLNVYWAMAFITERGHQRGGKKDAYFLWKGNSAVGYPKVAWNVVCKPIEEGGQGIRDILALNKALMSLWNVIQNNQSSIWVKWIAHTRLRHKSVWTVDVKGGSWGWRKILRLRSALLPYIEFKIGDGESFSLWHDPWHSLGSLITRFPRGPGRTNIPEAAKLSAVLVNGDWSWPPITDLECIEILHVLPIIHNGSDSILWRGGGFSTKAVYDIFRNHGPKVGWYSLLLGPCKIPRYSFVLWMAILDKLSTMDKPWLSHLGGVCVLCGREMETHEHLFFRCNYSRQCIRILKGTVRFTWPNRAWAVDIAWAAKKWNGRHMCRRHTELC
ncbi:UNVERIFIED_CONTAM: hypothetical protein Sradi_7089800 [Sesamum radiatum]|uniref:Reverse transcriptase domain-containing protein n=1 Tax=Sesamum radiatum TaxID=300843 RepID=A0AAW2J2T1_SESRA